MDIITKRMKKGNTFKARERLCFITYNIKWPKCGIYNKRHVRTWICGLEIRLYLDWRWSASPRGLLCSVSVDRVMSFSHVSSFRDSLSVCCFYYWLLDTCSMLWAVGCTGHCDTPEERPEEWNTYLSKKYPLNWRKVELKLKLSESKDQRYQLTISITTNPFIHPLS